MSKTITRADIIEAIMSKVPLSKNDVSQLVETLLTTVSKNLSEGESVKIPHFGTFTVRTKNERPGRNPRTGEDALVSARRVVTFRPSSYLRKKIANGS